MNKLIVRTMFPALLMAGFAGSASAADVTEVVTSDGHDRPVLVRFSPRYSFHRESGQVAREATCQAGDLDGAGMLRCATDQIVLNRELQHDRDIHRVDFGLTLGLPSRVQLHVVLPYVASDQTTLGFADGVTRDNSSIDPTLARVAADLSDGDFFSTYRYFNVAGARYPNRSGIGDMRIGVAWQPVNQLRHPHLATMTLGLDYVAPTGTARMGDNSGVGRGVHELQLRFAASRQYGFVEPFFQVSYAVPFAASKGLFGRIDDTQLLVRPGQRAEFTAGVDFELYHDVDRQIRINIDVGGRAGFITEGRDYGPLFEGLASSECNGITATPTGLTLNGSPYRPDASVAPDAAQCAWLVQQPGRADGNPTSATTAHAHNGITAIDNRFYYGINGQLRADLSPNFGLTGGFEVLFWTNHLVSGDRTGQDYNNNGIVDLDPAGIERNPEYNPTFDATGTRFFYEGVRTYRAHAGLYVQF